MMTHSLLRNLLTLLVISTGSATGQILDNFDNGNLYSNSTGTGSGFSSYGTVGVSESSGFAQMNTSGGYQTMVITSNDTVTPFGLGLSTAVFRFGSISLDSWQRLWVGYRHSNSTANHFYPYDYQTQGLYVSVNSGDGATSNRGNLVAVNEVGSRTTLATWNWADPYQLSNLVVTLRTTATNYELSFSGAAGGTPSFVSGAATGIITGLGTVGSRTFRMGVHNQYAGSSGGVRVDALEFSNVPTPEIAVEVDPATPVMDGGNLSFGVAAVGASVTRTFTIRNTGNADLTDLTISKSGPDSGEFTITTAPTAPVSGPVGTTTFTVTFTPADSGSKRAVLQLANNDPDESPFDISLIGGPEAEISVEQPVGTPLVDGSTTKSFPLTGVGAASELVFSVVNSGSGPLTPLNITIDGANAADFSVLSSPGASVGVSSSTTFTVRFTPIGNGVRTASLHLATNDVDESPFDIDLTGQAFGLGDIIPLVSLSGDGGPAYPRGDLTLGLDGNFYGMTSGGGTSGYGTVFKMTPEGVVTILVNFNYSTNGYSPNGNLIQASDGNFYGMTSSGGPSGSGTAFRMTPEGTLTTLVSFDGSNGYYPNGSLIEASDGNFYGMTSSGGAYGYGTAFKMTPEGALTTLVDFDYSTNGYGPNGSLIQGSDGDFYGMTNSGGPSGYGTAFKMTSDGTLTVLVSFDYYTNGYGPYGSLIQASDGNFYGMTSGGGYHGNGTAFRMTPDGTLTTLVDFDYSNGYNPQGSLMQASDGHLYGMAQYGGPNGYGVVFRLTLDGVITVLDSFDYSTDGYYPYGSLIQGNDGLLYGMTNGGGSGGVGTIFGLSIGAGPLALGEPLVLSVTPPKGLTFGGTSARITGRDFTDATGVTIGGLPATNVVVLNRSTITCTTPAHAAGAVSVLVTTPLGTSPANTLFTYNEPPEINVGQLAGIPQPSGSSLDFGGETAAPSENALKFDGQNDNVKVPTYSGINFTTRYTAETWMNVSNYQYGTLISKFEDDGDNRGWMINMGETGDATKLYVTQSASGAWVNPIQWNTGFSPVLNTWYHIAVVFDSALSSNQLKLYVNGVLTAQTSWYSTMVANNANLYLGGYDGPGNGVNGGANGRFFNGALDDVRLWNVARSASEILNGFNQNLAGTESGLVGHWKLNQGVAGGNNAGVTSVLATTGSNGTLVNSALSGIDSNWISRIATNLAGVVTKTFTISNDGAGPLDITSVSVAGGNVTDFTVNTSGMLNTVPAGGSTTFTVAFSPSASGARQTTLTLLNDDLDESSYSFVLTGYGVGPDDPGITGITPASGTTLGGTVITITGTKFTGATSVTLGGTAAAFTVDSDTRITCTTPAGSAGAASLRVTTPSGTNAPNLLFTYLEPNSPPTFSGFSASTPYQTAATISIGKLLTKAADVEADALSVSGAGPASAQGGTVVLQSGSIRYTPANGYSGADSFPVTITDARGASVSGTVIVTVQVNTGVGTNAAVLTAMSGDRMGLGFQGIPGRSYQIQRATDLNTWIPLGSVTAAANGAVVFIDESPPPGSAFYRLRKP